MKNNNTKFKQTEIGMIPEDWKPRKIGNEIELCYGKGLTKKKRLSGLYPVFGSNGIVGWHNKFLVEGPGIIIGVHVNQKLKKSHMIYGVLNEFKDNS